MKFLDSGEMCRRREGTYPTRYRVNAVPFKCVEKSGRVKSGTIKGLV